jgi:hypothetical protein
MPTKFIASILTGMSLTLGTVMTLPIQASPSSHTFSCVTVNGVLTTVAKRGNKQINMIRWSKNDGYFGGKWTPQERCQEVSANFQKFAQQGKLRYITHGINNGYPIVCVAQKKGGNCNGQLFTFRKNDNPDDKVRRLLDRNGIANNPLDESDPAYVVNINDKVYIDLDIYLTNAQTSINNEATPSNNNGTAQIQDDDSFWGSE